MAVVLGDLPIFSTPFPRPHFSPSTLLQPKLPLFSIKPLSRRKPKSPLIASSSSLPSSIPPSLPSLADLENLDSDNFPAVRTFENDLCRLSVIGDVNLNQSLAAAAADGGRAADEHISAGLRVMVVETVFPGNPNDRSTVSTRLFLPAKKVKEKAKKLKRSFTVDITSSITDSNILAVTFRQVVIQHLWSFELALFNSGLRRDMDDLSTPREIPFYCTVSSSDEIVLSRLAEAVCRCALDNMKHNLFQSRSMMDLINVPNYAKKYSKVSSTDSSVSLYQFSYDEILKYVKKIAKDSQSTEVNFSLNKRELCHSWWPSPNDLKWDKLDGAESSAWIQEFVPAYKLQVDISKFEGIKFSGWQIYGDNRCEILLSYSQMVELTDVLDMYFEDPETVPYKSLECKMDANSSRIWSLKRKYSFWRVIFSTAVAGFCLLSIVVVGKLLNRRHFNLSKPSTELSSSSSVMDTDSSRTGADLSFVSTEIELSPSEMEKLCLSVIERIKSDLHWPGDIVFESDKGAWIGEIPNYVGERSKSAPWTQDIDSDGTKAESLAPHDASLAYQYDPEAVVSGYKKNTVERVPAVQDIASFEVVLSRDGEVVGFQPTSEVAVNNWAGNPLAKALYKRRKLTPGLFEPQPRIPPPNQAVVMELLMSVNQDSCFALVRPISVVSKS